MVLNLAASWNHLAMKGLQQINFHTHELWARCVAWVEAGTVFHELTENCLSAQTLSSENTFSTFFLLITRHSTDTSQKPQLTFSAKMGWVGEPIGNAVFSEFSQLILSHFHMVNTFIISFISYQEKEE